MRRFALLALATTFAAPTAAHARLFWQTYGSTVPAPGGCAWNLNSDYFVPRTCNVGRYDLFSPCKSSHSLSPACRNLHPVYGGYCTPYGSWHYLRRDHISKKHCGCTPLRHEYGSWHLDKCRKHCHVLRPAAQPACGESYACEVCGLDAIPNVEPLGGETLGTVVAMAGALRTSGGAAMARPPLPTGQTLPAPLGLLPGASGSAGALPEMIGN